MIQLTATLHRLMAAKRIRWLWPLVALLFTEGIYRGWSWANAPTSDDSTFELYAIGGSTVVGEPYNAISGLNFPALASRMLGGRIMGRRIEIHNLAQQGASLYPQTFALRRWLRWRDNTVPAAVLIYSGHNEWLDEAGPSAAHSVWRAAKRGIGRVSWLLGDLWLVIDQIKHGDEGPCDVE